ncbi:MAG: GNAT family N-acetyltransferase [Pseudomonadales bacterium]|jgi:GNAT superfamily N-acetyltransferase|nr:GNAT family N-acetyltransferase [Pseudomonadales bacterium]
MPDPALLDNPVWHALDSLQKALGISEDDAALYDYLISIFAAVETPGNLETLTRLTSQGRILGLLTRPDEVAASLDGWDEMAQIPVHQMIYPNPTSDEAGHYGRRLNDDDAEAMFALAKLTEPGPFGKKTGQMGSYFGVDGDAGLISMAGERFRLPGWTEVSGVCSHPEARGKGYAFKLIEDVLRGIVAQNAGAFLHVRIGSPSEKTAVELYERLGFEHHQTMVVQILKRT